MDSHCGSEEVALKMLVERVADYAIFMLDKGGHITTWNPAAARMKGYSEQEVLGKHYSMLYTEEDAKAGVPDEHLRIASAEGFYRGDGRRRRKSGEIFPAEVEITPLGDSIKGSAYAKIVRDISARSRDHDRLRQANRDLEDFAAIAANDLQEPLRQMMNYLALHERRSGASFDDQSRGYVAQAVNGAKRMQRLLTYLLALARIGTEDLPIGPVDMSSAWLEAVDSLGERIHAVHASVTNEALPSAVGHRQHLVQLFKELLANALLYLRPGVKPTVHLSCTPAADGRTLTFSLKDNGIGIAPEDVKRIFVAFRRLHRREFPGFGLGLALCQKVIEHHDGRLWVDSEVGRGSSFHFTLKKA